MRQFYGHRLKPFYGVSFTTTATKISLASPVSPTSFTACLWVYPTTLSSSKALFSIDDGTTHQVSIATGTSPAVMVGVDSGAHDSGTLLNLTANVWSFLAVTSSSSGLVGYGKATPQSAMVNVSLAFATGATTGTTVYINGDGLGDTGIIAEYAGFKLWPFVMSQSQIVQEATQLAPVTGGWSYVPIRRLATVSQDEKSSALWTQAGTFAVGLPTKPAPVPEERTIRGRSWLYVNTSGNTNAFAVAISAAATATDAIIVARGLADAVVGQATLADTLKVARPMTDAIAGAATMLDAMGVARHIVDAVSGQASVTDAVNVARHIVDATVGQATVTDAAKVARAMADTIGGHASAAFAEAVARHMADAIAGQASVTDALSVNRALSEVIAGQAIAIFNNSGGSTVAFVVSIGGHVTLVDALSMARAMAEAIHGAATMSDALSLARGMGLVVDGASSLSAQIAIARTFGLPISAHAIVSATLPSSGGGLPWPFPFPMPVPPRFGP
jgi:hypothetical protein